MRTKNYTVFRNAIYVGAVIKQYSTNPSKDKLYQRLIGAYCTYCRSILFVLDEKRRANDLLYHSPLYPIKNITDNSTTIDDTYSGIYVKGAYNLEQLLNYFNYPEELSYSDIVRIRKSFFNKRFAWDNCELFGYKEIMAEDMKFGNNNGLITEPKELERQRACYRRDQQLGFRAFTPSTDYCPLLPELFYVLTERGDQYILNAILGDKKINAFKPSLEEGIILRLKN